MTLLLLTLSVLVALSCATAMPAEPDARHATVTVSLAERSAPLEIDRMALGQGGLSDQPMWDARTAEIRALRPRLIRLFIQEYFRLLPTPDRYHFDSLDRSVDTILRTGAKPLMCICFKPSVLFPAIDEDRVEPDDYEAWERLIYALVRHYRDRGAGIRYWEVANEPDIGESGGCPYRFTPEAYARYYRHTVRAILRADPDARVGGPALAYVRSPILPALLDACDHDRLPLHYVSWHIYSSSPEQIRSTIEYVKGLLKAHPGLHPETMLNEWNMDLMNPVPDHRFQPCYVMETIWQMKDAGLDWSCYYHIRDWHVDEAQFRPFMSTQGTAFMARWWNRMPQFDGLFDYQNTIRPAYFAFKLLSRLTGERLRLETSDPAVHGYATWDPNHQIYNVLVWNFSPSPVTVDVELRDVPQEMLLRHLTLDALAPSDDENARLQPSPSARLAQGEHRIQTTLDAFGVQFWSLE